MPDEDIVIYGIHAPIVRFLRQTRWNKLAWHCAVGPMASLGAPGCQLTDSPKFGAIVIPSFFKFI